MKQGDLGLNSPPNFAQRLSLPSRERSAAMKEAGPAKIDFQRNRFALAVRDAARQASIRGGVLEEYVSHRPEIRAEMERLKSQGLDPTAWLHVISIPRLFKINE